VTVPGGTPLSMPRCTPASGLAAAEARPVDARPVAAASPSAGAPSWGPSDATIPVWSRSPARSRAASSGMPPLWGAMDVQPVSTAPRIRVTPLLHDLMADHPIALEGSARCNRI